MDKKKALETFMTGENFHLQHYLGAHREEKMESMAILFVCGHPMLRLYIW